MFGESRKTWLEAGLDGGDAAAVIAQGVACVKAGAAIVQVPAMDASGCVRVVEGIRGQVDAVVYPTLDLSQAGLSTAEELGRLGLIEWLPLVPGSANLCAYDDLREDRPGSTIGGAEPAIRAALKVARRFGLHPAYAIHEPGFLRLGATLYWRESPPAPLYRLVFSSGYTCGFPPEDYALTAYLKLLDQVAPGAQWMIAGLQADILPLLSRAVMEGGHVRVGQADLGSGGGPGTLDLVEAAAAAIGSGGVELAEARDVRAALTAEEQV